jgi:TolB-like protein/Tfp pilus assembly protein PilF
MSIQARLTSDTGADAQACRLESWKEIAAYLGRDVTTVRRWEKREGLPVHRLQHSKLGSVYAYTKELDAWRNERAPATATAAPEARQIAESVGRGYHARTAALAAMALVLAAGVIWIVRERTTVQPASANGGIRSLAVLPLENFSGNPEQDYLSDGMTEALISRLSAIHALRVISRTSAMHFKGTRKSVPAIGKELNVDAVIEGSMVRSGDKIRISVQLIRADTDEHFWSETYDRELGDALVLQSEVAQAIAGRVQATVTGAERARLVAARKVSPDVYESYLKGQFTGAYSRAGVEKSIGYFEEAIKKDPAFAPAYVGLANAYDELGTPGIAGAPPSEVRPKVINTVRKALELDPALPEAHALLAGVYQEQWQWSEAESEYKRALELNPNDAGAHLGFGGWLLCQGRTEEAQAWSRRARELDPFGVTGNNIGWILFQSRHYEEAIRELRSDLAVHPDDASTYWFLGFALIANGQADEAIAVLQKSLALSERSPAVIGMLVRAYAHAGRRTEALRLLDELERRQRTGYVPAAAFVNAYLGLGDNEQAFAWLERAYKEPSRILQFVKVHPFFDPLRGDPRFADLVRRVGLDQAR